MKKSRILLALLLVAALFASTAVIPSKAVSAASGISISSKTLKKAKANLKLIVNGEEIPMVTAMKVSGKYDGEKTTYAYLPLQVFCENMGIELKQKKKNVTLSIPNGIKVTFKTGKDGYTVNLPETGKVTMKFGKSVTRNDMLYVPAELFVALGENIGFDISYDVTKKAVNLYVAPIVPINLVKTGAWALPESPVVTKEIQDLLDKALETYVGVDLEAVALFGTQLVAGTNYGLLCRATPVVPNAESSYVIVTLYADLQGNVQITEVEDTGVKSQVNNLPGGWSQPASVELSEEYLQYFNEVMGQTDGVVYYPIALVEYQMANPVKACIFALCDVMIPDSPMGCAFLYANINILKKEAEVTDILTFYKEEN